MDLREREFPWAARGDAIYLNNASDFLLPILGESCLYLKLHNAPPHPQWAIAKRREACAKVCGAGKAYQAQGANQRTQSQVFGAMGN